MNWTPGSHAHYNREFAEAVVKAFMSQRKKLRFRKRTYVVAEHIDNVREDLLNHMYKIKVI